MAKKGIGNKKEPVLEEEPNCGQFHSAKCGTEINVCGTTGYSCRRAKKEGLCIKGKKPSETGIISDEEWDKIDKRLFKRTPGKPTELRKKYGKHCEKYFIEPCTGRKIYCTKIPDHDKETNTDLQREHISYGYRWKGDDPLGEQGTSGIFMFRIDNLYYTTGGRIVKPGPGESACEKYGDILLMTADELQRGIPMSEFMARMVNAIEKHNIKPNCPKCKSPHNSYPDIDTALNIAMEGGNDTDCRKAAREWLKKKCEAHEKIALNTVKALVEGDD